MARVSARNPSSNAKVFSPSEKGDQLELVVSPFNILVGAWVRKRRRIEKMELAARLFDLAPSYYKSLESGTNALPSDSVVGLANLCDITFSQASELIACVRYMETRFKMKDGGTCNLDGMLMKAQKLTELKPSFGPVYEWLETIIKSKLPEYFGAGNGDSQLRTVQAIARYRQDDVPVFLGTFDKFVRDGSNPSSDVNGAGAPREGYFGLSPIYEDMLAELVSGLRELTPQLNLKTIEWFERKNYARIRSVHGFVKDHSRFLNGFEKYQPTYMNNGIPPTFNLFIRGKKEDAEALQEELRKTYREKNTVSPASPRASLAKQFFVSAISNKQFKDEIELKLWFDLSKGTLVKDVSDDLRRKGQEDKIYEEFSNLWIYELAASDNEPRKWFAFLDLYDERLRNSYYAVPLKISDTKEARASLKKCLQKSL